MREVLFDGKHDVSLDEVIVKMNYFLSLAEEAKELHDVDLNSCFVLARRIRAELEKERKNNGLKRTWHSIITDQRFKIVFHQSQDN